MDEMKKMKRNFITVVITIVFFVNCISSTNLNYYSVMPAGEYKVFYRTLFSCAPTLKSDIQLNWFLNKISANTTEIIGNFTNSIAIDDSLSIEMYTANKNSIGGWSDFIFQMKVLKFCSSLKTVGGKAYNSIATKIGINNTNCPIYPGVYVSKGVPTSLFFKNTNVPKIFFYGSYKFKFYIMRKKEILACLNSTVDVKRPWEME